MTPPVPTLRVERALLREGIGMLACVDEVGRGALAGPVTVGVTVLTLDVRSAPRGLRDSKLLTPRARHELAPRLRRWPLASAVGHAEAAEVDSVGIIAAQRVAAARAFGELGELGMRTEVALLDGCHDWLRVPNQALALFPDPRGRAAEELADLTVLPTRVVTRVRADLTCAGVAAASVLAKVERDTRMVGLSAQHPHYGWAVNKGYSAPDHVEALRRHGPSPLHRRSWNLPGAGLAASELADLPDMTEAELGGLREADRGDVTGADEAVDLPRPERVNLRGPDLAHVARADQAGTLCSADLADATQADPR